jgi:hypothetical protein
MRSRPVLGIVQSLPEQLPGRARYGSVSSEWNRRNEIGEPIVSPADSTGVRPSRQMKMAALSAMIVMGKAAMKPAEGLKIRRSARFRTNMATDGRQLSHVRSRRGHRLAEFGDCRGAIDQPSEHTV